MTFLQAEVEPGRTYTFEIEVTNIGTLPSSPISLSDIPSSAPLRTTTVFPIALLNPDDSADIVFEMTLPADTPVGGVFQGSLSVRSGLSHYPMSFQVCSINPSGGS